MQHYTCRIIAISFVLLESRAVLLADDVLPSRPAATSEFFGEESIAAIVSSREGSQLSVVCNQKIQVLSSRTLAPLRMIPFSGTSSLVHCFDNGSGYSIGTDGVTEWGFTETPKLLKLGQGEPSPLQGRIGGLSQSELQEDTLLVTLDGSNLRLAQRDKIVFYGVNAAKEISQILAVNEYAVIFRSTGNAEYCSMTGGIRSLSVDGIRPSDIGDGGLVHPVEIDRFPFLINFLRGSKEVQMIGLVPSPHLVAVAELGFAITDANDISIASHRSLVAVAIQKKVHFISINESNIDLNYSFDFSELIGGDEARIEQVTVLDESGSIGVVMDEGQILCVWNSLLLQGEESITGHNFAE